MPREAPGYREVVTTLFEVFGKWNITVKEYAAYLGKNEDTVRARITEGKLPGRVEKSAGKNREFIIPINAIALYEVHSQGVQP